jgi:hypothetical protein
MRRIHKYFLSLLVVGMLGIGISIYAEYSKETSREKVKEILNKEQERLASESQSELIQVYEKVIPIIMDELPCVARAREISIGKSFWYRTNNRNLVGRVGYSGSTTFYVQDHNRDFFFSEVSIIEKTVVTPRGGNFQFTDPGSYIFIGNEAYVPTGDGCFVSTTSLKQSLSTLELGSDYKFAILYLRHRFLESRPNCEGEHVNSDIENTIDISPFNSSVDNKIAEHIAGLLGCSGSKKLSNQTIDHEQFWEFDYADFFDSTKYYVVARLEPVHIVERGYRPGLFLLVFRPNPVPSPYLRNIEEDVYGQHTILNSLEGSAFTRISMSAWFRGVFWTMLAIPIFAYGTKWGFAILLGFLKAMFDFYGSRDQGKGTLSIKQVLSVKQVLSENLTKVQGIARSVKIRDHSFTDGSSFSGTGSTHTYYKHYLDFRLEIATDDGGFKFKDISLEGKMPFNLQEGDTVLVGFTDYRTVGLFNITGATCTCFIDCLGSLDCDSCILTLGSKKTRNKL